MKFIRYYDSPLGPMLMEAEDDALCGLWFVGQKHFPKEYTDSQPSSSIPQILEQATLWLDRYFAGDRPDASSLRLKPQGSSFSLRVWAILRSIDYGETITYGEIAKRIESESGHKVSAQAVGGAVGRNPISLIIPCHRVIGSKGKLTGYAGGIERKAALLKFEKDTKKPPLL